MKDFIQANNSSEEAYFTIKYVIDVIQNNPNFNLNNINDVMSSVTSKETDPPGILHSRVCSSSFNFVQVGNGFTTQVNKTYHTYGKVTLSPPFIYNLGYTIGSMCIQVSGSDQFGTPLTGTKAAELSAYAMDNARLALLEDIGISIFTESGARNDFRFYFENALSELTGGNGTSTVSYGNCQGNIPESDMMVSPFGIFWCANYYPE